MKKIILLVFATIIYSCSSEDSNNSNCDDEHSLQTLNATNIIDHKAVLNGTIELSSCENATASSLGFVYSTSPNPTIMNEVVYLNTSEQNLSSEISNLEFNNTYYVRVFVREYNDNVYYGNEISFETNTNGLTYVPDDIFESKLIELGYDDFLNDYVVTNNIIDVGGLNLNDSGVSDLTGIEDFSALWKLDLNNCNLSSIDLTNNIAMQFLEFNNNNINSIDLTQNINLKLLRCYENNLTSLDLSNCPDLFILNGNANNLEFVNIANGNNPDILEMFLSVGNASNLCIQIDSGFTPPNCGPPNTQPRWCISPTANYSFDCQ